MAIKLRPGEKVPYSGQYKVLGARGKDLKREVTLVRGESAPPTQKKGQTMVLVDKTKHAKK